MSVAWPLVVLSDVATPVSRAIPVQPGTSYRTIGVKWWGGGAYERETIDGAQTAAKTLSIVKTGDLIINKIWVRHGSTAIATEAVDGCAASGEFPTFILNRELVEPRWMHWLTQTQSFWNNCAELSRGTSGKNRIKPELFLTIRFPLPPLAEQQRILARIDELTAKIKEAQGLRQQAMEEAEFLCRSLVFGDNNSALTPMHELVRPRGHTVNVKADETYHFAGVYCFGRGVFRGQKKSGMDFAYKQLGQLKAGNFVYPKLMAWEGALGIVPKECDGLFVSPEFPIFEVIENRVLPETLDVYFRTPSVWPQIAGESTGTNVRRRRLNPKDFLEYKIPLPSMQTQLRLRKVMKKIDVLKRLQNDTADELDAMLPSILNKAFKGEFC